MQNQPHPGPVGLAPTRGVPGAYEVYRGLVVTAIASNPATHPALAVWLRERHVPVLAIQFPEVPGLVVDGWMFEASGRYATLDGIGVVGDDQLQVRHRFLAAPTVVHVTTVRAAPGEVEIAGTLEIDGDAQLDACLDAIHRTTAHYWPWLRPRGGGLPDLAPDLCFQLIRSPSFQTAPLAVPRNSAEHAPYLHRFASRCLLFTRDGATPLAALPRTEIASKHPDIDDGDPRNSPPVAQLYFPEAAARPAANYCNTTRFTQPVIAAASADGEYLVGVAVAGGSVEMLYQGWLDCLHCYSHWTPADRPAHERSWRLRLHALPNRPELLLERVQRDFST